MLRTIVVVAKEHLVVAALLASAAAASAAGTSDFSWCFPSASWHSEDTYLSWQDDAAFLNCTAARLCITQSPSILHLPPFQTDIVSETITKKSTCADKCNAAVTACKIATDVPRSQAQQAFDCVYRTLLDTCTPGCTTLDHTPIDCGYVAFVEPTQPAESTQDSSTRLTGTSVSTESTHSPSAATTLSPNEADSKANTSKAGLVAGIAVTCSVGAAAGVGAIVYASTKAAAVGASTTALAANAPVASTIKPTFLPAEEEVAAALGSHTGAIVGGSVGSTVAAGTIVASAFYRSETNANAGASPVQADNFNPSRSTRAQRRRSNIFESPMSTGGQSDLVSAGNDEGVSPIDIINADDPAILPSRVPPTRFRGPSDRVSNRPNDSSIVFVLPESRSK